MSYRVYLISFISMGPQGHQAIFVETHESGCGTGHLFHVTGNISGGMKFEDKRAHRPEASVTFQSKALLGSVTIENYPRILSVCEGIAAPKKQYQLNKCLYPHEPLKKCQEWAMKAVAALKEAHVLENNAQVEA